MSVAIYDPILISNIGLGYIGDKTIASFTENSEAARQCQRFYPHAVQTSFEAHGWNCFKRTFNLVLLPTPPATLLRWKYAYSYPPNCARVEAYGENLDMEPRYNDVSETADWIAANMNPLFCEFTGTDFAEATWPGYFVQVVGNHLAILVASKLEGTLASRVELEDLLEKKTLPRARSRDSLKIATRTVTRSGWGDRRFGRRIRSADPS
jgi:hypothetical protein